MKSEKTYTTKQTSVAAYLISRGCQLKSHCIQWAPHINFNFEEEANMQQITNDFLTMSEEEYQALDPEIKKLESFIEEVMEALHLKHFKS